MTGDPWAAEYGNYTQRDGICKNKKKINPAST